MGRMLLMMSAIVTVALLLPDAFFERASTGLASGDEQAITAGRLDEIWRPLIGTFWEAPIFGHGLYSTAWATPHFSGTMFPVTLAHSAYLDVALDLGMVGIVVVAAANPIAAVSGQTKISSKKARIAAQDRLSVCAL